ncbi:MAG: hypothetical protein CM15mP48_1680 [Candidatus Poseidoniales archaeon]|nr:MAG: hypothetical protein CM15mP48_1680 [Candidatus Poseidoniales archaeon]
MLRLSAWYDEPKTKTGLVIYKTCTADFGDASIPGLKGCPDK